MIFSYFKGSPFLHLSWLRLQSMQGTVQGPVVQYEGRIVIFSSFVKAVVDWYNSYQSLIFISEMCFFYTSCVVYVRSFTVFQAFYRGWKNHYPVDSAIRPSYNRPQAFSQTAVCRAVETPVILASAPAVGTSAERLDLDTPAKSLIDPSDWLIVCKRCYNCVLILTFSLGNPHYEICSCTTKSIVYPILYYTIIMDNQKSILFPIKVHIISILWIIKMFSSVL
jgi:hypothetical protein